MTIVNEIKKPGIVIRDISSDFEDGTYDVLITDEKGICRYSPEVFNTVDSAENMLLLLMIFLGGINTLTVKRRPVSGN